MVKQGTTLTIKLNGQTFTGAYAGSSVDSFGETWHTVVNGSESRHYNSGEWPFADEPEINSTVHETLRGILLLALAIGAALVIVL
jgi:hypothetical protein